MTTLQTRVDRIEQGQVDAQAAAQKALAAWIYSQPDKAAADAWTRYVWNGWQPANATERADFAEAQARLGEWNEATDGPIVDALPARLPVDIRHALEAACPGEGPFCREQITVNGGDK